MECHEETGEFGNYGVLGEGGRVGGNSEILKIRLFP